MTSISAWSRPKGASQTDALASEIFSEQVVVGPYYTVTTGSSGAMLSGQPVHGPRRCRDR